MGFRSTDRCRACEADGPTETGKLTESDGNVAISGNTMAATGGGSVYRFAKPVGGWINSPETDMLIDSDSAGLGAVSISGSTVVAASLTTKAE